MFAEDVVEHDVEGCNDEPAVVVRVHLDQGHLRTKHI